MRRTKLQADVFQSTLPARGATPNLICKHYISGFQSTLPARGATYTDAETGRAIQISIHAPRTGSDFSNQVGGTRRKDFNPRSPHGERPGNGVRTHDQSHFNPRSPHGERRKRARTPRLTPHFNPRSPHGERHGYYCEVAPTGTFQSTLPARGATCMAISYAALKSNFNPRSPHGERPVAHGWSHGRKISIHAPRTGSDALRQQPCDRLRISIHAPRTGSDGSTPAKFAVLTGISIHAPRTGSDPAGPVAGADRFPFQSTLPARGATSVRAFRLRNRGISIHAPRTGSDQRLPLRAADHDGISIHAPRTGSDNLPVPK